MKDIRQVLRQKEIELDRVRTEVEALHVAIGLLADESDWAEHGSAPPPRYGTLTKHNAG
jgi:hypothetical protein